MTDARANILRRLRAAPASPVPTPDYAPLETTVTWTDEDRLPRLQSMMEAVNTEFVFTTSDDWPQALHKVLTEAGARNVLTGTGGSEVAALRAAWEAQGFAKDVALMPYDTPLEARKSDLFLGTDAGFTATRGGIADTGSLILWPGAEAPRSLSLIPPLHVALLDARQIHDTLWHAMRAQDWAADMPTNALLVSGPSKTADIEQTLAYGVHGPKRLVVLVHGQDRNQR